MANAKSIRITGCLPYNCIENSEDCTKLLALLNTPSFGLRIKWEHSFTVPNTEIDPETPHKEGKTTIYRFTIEGIEAVRWEWIDWVKETVKNIPGGSILSENSYEI